MKIQISCSLCPRKYTYDPQRRQGHTRTKCNSCSVNRRRFEIKRRAVEYKGGSCQRCGYSKCVEALHFHHLDPNEKDFGIGNAHCRSWDSIKRELDKCDLICANCHAEVHSELRPPVA